MPASPQSWLRHTTVAQVTFLLAGGVICTTAMAQEMNSPKNDNAFSTSPLESPSEESTPSAPRQIPKSQPLTNGKSSLRREKASTKSLTTKNPDQQYSLGVGAAVLMPILRPSVLFSVAMQEKLWAFGGRLSASYATLSSNFKEAADKSDYAERISSTDASLWDLHLVAPEIRRSLPSNFFLSLAPSLKATLCTSNYSTKASEPLDFRGWAVSLNAHANSGYRIEFRENRLNFEIFAALSFPFWSSGGTEISYQRAEQSSTSNFSESELESMLNSLQPYLEKLSKLPTTEFGVTAVWKL